MLIVVFGILISRVCVSDLTPEIFEEFKQEIIEMVSCDDEIDPNCAGLTGIFTN